MEVEMLVGDQAMMVSRVHSWPSLDLGAVDGMDPALMYFPGQCMKPEYPQYSQQMPPDLYQPMPPLAPLYYPPIPPPLSPHYDAAILALVVHLYDVGFGNDVATAMVWHGRVGACQFHPEKSGQAGAVLLTHWLSWLHAGAPLPA